MHTVDLLAEATDLVRRSGVKVLEDWLDGCEGGHCEIAGRTWLILDLGQSPRERLAVVLDYLVSHAGDSPAAVSPGLRELIGSRRAA